MLFRQIVSQANNDLNSEKVKSTRKKLIIAGGIMTAVGVIGFITCLILFTVCGVRELVEEGPSIKVFVPIIFFFPCSLLMAFGITILRAGMSIVITGYGAHIIDVNRCNKCPKCGTKFPEDAKFCVNCGENLKTIFLCPTCKTKNEPTSKYCKTCGERLDR